MAIKEVLGKFVDFFTSKKFKGLRNGVFAIAGVSLIVVLITLFFWFGRSVESKNFEVTTFAIVSNKVSQSGDTLIGKMIFNVDASSPCTVKLLIDNIRGQEQRTVESSVFSSKHLINVTFSKDELLRPFVVSGVVTDRLGKEYRLESIDFLPGQSRMQITIE
ncbi:hypothetical protein JXM83_04725 [Candidatus Woesearchaeota archaeon]|nr:hypothetical protein [Candidatus Woesearchaeota archaeon]